jgi:hypothetical protein
MRNLHCKNFTSGLKLLNASFSEFGVDLVALV